MTRVIFFIESPFTERDYSRYGIEILQKNGFNVEVWDFAPVLHPKVYQYVQVSGAVSFGGYKRFLVQDEALVAISELTHACFVVSLITCRYETFAIYRALSVVQVGYCMVVINAIPAQSTVKDPMAILAQMKQASPFQLFNALISRIPFQYMGIRPATVLLAGGVQSIRHRNKHSMNQETKILWAHTLDYDLYLNEQDKPIHEDAKMGVFLDEYLPFHPDYGSLGTSSPSGPEDYYPSLCRFFDFLEREYRVRIVIAAHPRARYEDHPDYFGGRPVVKGETLELVRKSGFVISHSSTALNFAVLFHKPVLFITTNKIQQNQKFSSVIHGLAVWLNKIPINVDGPLHLNWGKELAIDLEAYARYREAYIKKSGSPEKPAWQIFADFLKAVYV